MKNTTSPSRRIFWRSLFWLGVTGASAGLQAQSAPATKNEEAIQLSAFEVSESQDHGYSSTNAVSGTRFSTPLVNIPQSIVVLNQEFMKDIGAISTVEAAQYVSGVATTAGPNRDVFIVNGYGVTVTTDGFQDDTSQGQGLTTPLEMVDRVEIIKGPSAVLYGSTNPGGNVNRVTKKPMFGRTATDLEATVGEGGLVRGVVDTNQSGKLGTTPVAARVIGSFEHYDQYANFGDSYSYFIAPMFSWRITPNTTLQVTPSYLDRNYHKKFATLFQFRPYNLSGPLSFQLPRDVDWGGDSPREKFLVRRLYAQLEHVVSDHWTLRLTGIRKYVSEYVTDVIPRDLLTDNQTMQRTWRQIYADDNYKIAALDSLMKYDLGPTTNQTLIAAQYYSPESTSYTITGRKTTGQKTSLGEGSNTTSNLPLINVFNPDPAALNAGPDQKFMSAFTEASGAITSASVNHMLQMFHSKVIVNGGIRFDHTESAGTNKLTNVVTSSGKNNHYTKRIGAAYKALPGLSFFYNYSETFTPQLGVNPDGTGFKPTEGKISEGGFKADLMEGRISGTASLFTVVNKNLVVADPDPIRASAGFRSQSAKDTLDGVQFDLHFDVVRNLQVLTSYSHLTSKTNNGLRVRDVPNETAAALASYAFGGTDPKFKVGLGARYKGDRFGTTDNALLMSSVIVWDAFANYQVSKQLVLRLNCTNVFDKYYADSSVNRNLIFAGPERRLRITAEYRF